MAIASPRAIGSEGAIEGAPPPVYLFPLPYPASSSMLTKSFTICVRLVALSAALTY